MPLGENDHRGAAEVRAALDAQRDAMIADLEKFVNVESPSLERECLERSAHFLADLMTRVLGKPPTIIASDRGPHVHWKGSLDRAQRIKSIDFVMLNLKYRFFR